MQTIQNPLAFIIVRTYTGGKRENLLITLNEDTARREAASYIGKEGFIHLETCKIQGKFVMDDKGRIVE